MFQFFQTALTWIHDNPVLRWVTATFLSLVYFLDDKPYHLIVVWAVVMLADLFSRLWRLAYENGGFLVAIRSGVLCSARLIQGVADELAQLFIWSFIAWSLTIPVPNDAYFDLGGHKVVIDNLIRSLPFAYLAIGDMISIAENFMGSIKGTKKQQFYHWILETFVLLANALRMRLVSVIGGGVYMGGYPSMPDPMQQPPIIPEMHVENGPKANPPLDHLPPLPQENPGNP